MPAPARYGERADRQLCTLPEHEVTDIPGEVRHLLTCFDPYHKGEGPIGWRVVANSELKPIVPGSILVSFNREFAFQRVPSSCRLPAAPIAREFAEEIAEAGHI